MTVDGLQARHPMTLAGTSTTRLSSLPARWLPLLDVALKKLETLLTAEELRSLRLDIFEKYNSLRIDASLADLKHPRWRELQEAIEKVCVEAEDASERA